MALLWYTVTTLSALAAVHRLFQFHAVHSLFVSCASRTDTRHQTRFENLEPFFIPSRALPASKWPRLVTFEFEKDGDGILIHVPEGSYWGTPTVRHHTRGMCREIYIVSGEWSVGQFMAVAPISGPPERPDSWQGIYMRFGPPQLPNGPSEVRRFGSEEAQQLDHMIFRMHNFISVCVLHHFGSALSTLPPTPSLHVLPTRSPVAFFGFRFVPCFSVMILGSIVEDV
ncbi:hypothetical protein BM221_006069 [Beauveria bassiana]|uniref:Uncharacterized protein n=1 Tax=Beauveria bassiana TaxID=176275 RepID=A0A2N6NKW5_BEABA|nr:hypothetical protein BM221_006069 [Beauveria bassiana]